MTEARKPSIRPIHVLLSVTIAVVAIAGCFFVAYGLKLINPGESRARAVRVKNEASVAAAMVGDVVTYVVTVSNGAGRGTMEIVAVSDTLLGDLSAAFPSRLVAGASDRQVFTRTVQPGDPDPLVNTVTVSAAAGGNVVEATSTAEVDLLKPAVHIRAACRPHAAQRGEDVAYSVSVSNVGEVDLESVTVTDSLEGDLSASFPSPLMAGASQGQTFTWTIPSDGVGPLTRTVTVRASAAGEVVSDTAAVVVELLRPSVRVEADVDPVATVRGQTVTYTVTLVNAGPVDLEAITVADSLQGDLSRSFSAALTAGASQREQFAWAIGWDDPLPVSRTVTVRAEGGGEIVSDTVQAVVDSLKPILQVEASVAPTTTLRGGAATYTLTVMNAGELDVGNLRVVDSLMGDVSQAFPRALPPGTFYSRAYTWSSEVDAAGPLIRNATVSGEGAKQVISDTATATLELTGVMVSVNGPDRAQAGERLVANVAISNTSSGGAADLVLDSVTGSDGDLTEEVPDTCRALASGDACSFGYEVIAPPDTDALNTGVEVRYRPEGLSDVVAAAGEHVLTVIPPWERGIGMPAETEVRTVVVCPGDPDVLYAGFGSRGYGVYRSRDAGQSWAPTALAEAQVFGIAVDPVECGTVYAGAWRDGVQKSEDGGRSWTASGEGLGGAFVYSVVVDPANVDILYAGTAERGVYRSEDGGSTWRSWGLAPLTVPDLSVGPDGRVVIAATWGEGVFRRERSEAGWGAWAAINTGIPAVHHDTYAVAMDPEDGRTIFVATAAGGVYRSVDGGGTWEQVLSSPRTAYAVLVEAGDSGVVYAGTAEGVYRSAAGGEPGSWEAYSSGVDGLAVRSLTVGAEDGDYVHLGSADGAWRRPR